MEKETRSRLIEKAERLKSRAEIIERVLKNIYALDGAGWVDTDTGIRIESSNARSGMPREITRSIYREFGSGSAEFYGGRDPPFYYLTQVDPLCAKLAEYRKTEDTAFSTGIDPWIISKLTTRGMEEEEYLDLLNGRKPIARYNPGFRVAPEGSKDLLDYYFEYEVFLNPNANSVSDLVRWVHEDEKGVKTTLLR